MAAEAATVGVPVAGGTMARPRHVAIIMDGNGRWATERGWPRLVGHRRGAERVKEVMEKHEMDGFIAIGGEGTLTVARMLHDEGVPVVGVPKTIDNDLSATDVTFGFETAVAIATESIDRLRTTA